MTFEQIVELYKLGVFKRKLLHLDKMEYNNLASKLQELELPITRHNFSLIDYKDARYVYKTLLLSNGLSVKLRSSSDMNKLISKYLKKNNIVTFEQHLVQTILGGNDVYTLNY